MLLRVDLIGLLLIVLLATFMGLLLSDFLDEVLGGLRLKPLRAGGGDDVALLLGLTPPFPTTELLSPILLFDWTPGTLSTLGLGLMLMLLLGARLGLMLRLLAFPG